MTNELSKVERDRLANAAAIQEQVGTAAPRACGQCGNPHPGTLIEGICADCQRDNQLSIFDASKRDPYDAAWGLDGDPGPSLYR
jgi:hypothetical protein